MLQAIEDERQKTRPAPAAADDLFVGLELTGSTLYVDSPHIPPDTIGAVGPDHIVELINGRYSAYRKSDGERVQTSTLNDLWIDAGIDVRQVAFDPRVHCDAASGRWFASSAHPGRARDGSVLIAVSRSADPTEGWWALEVDRVRSPTSRCRSVGRSSTPRPASCSRTG